MQLQVAQNLILRAGPDMHTEAVLGAPPDNFIPAGSTVELRYDYLSTACRRYDISSAAHSIWCPVAYGDHTGWANAFYLDTGNGRLSCLVDPSSIGCASAEPASPPAPQAYAATSPTAIPKCNDRMRFGCFLYALGGGDVFYCMRQKALLFGCQW